jgi:DNA-binding NtrC family response regulator
VMRVGGNYPIPIDVRLIAATNQDLDSMVKQGRFRADLFYRLQVIPLALPPLRSRPEDIPILATHFLSQANRSGRKRFSPGVLEFMQTYPWPGNIRQMASVIHFMVHTSENETMEITDLPPSLAIEKPGPTEAVKTYKASNRNNRLAFIILSTLALSRDGKGVGKKTLLAGSRQADLVVSDCQMRKLLRELDQEGLIRIGSTSQGTAITEKGMSVLDSMSHA